VAGTGKPANNATVGATWKSNITSQPSDTVLLNANTTPADIGYTGALDATKGATWKSNVSNQPSDASIITSQGTAAAIASQGDFATLDQVTADNINTYIAGAAIDTAYIKNAAITTLKVKEQSIVKTAGIEMAKTLCNSEPSGGWSWMTLNTITSSIIANIDVTMIVRFRMMADASNRDSFKLRFKITVGTAIYYTCAKTWGIATEYMNYWEPFLKQISSSTPNRTVTIELQVRPFLVKVDFPTYYGGTYDLTTSIILCRLYQR
jgi:hypothetical protein